MFFYYDGSFYYYATQPWSVDRDFLRCATLARTRVAFIDLAWTREMRDLANGLIASGHEVVIYMDHHEPSVELSSMPPGVELRLKSRAEAPSCARLMETGEARERGVNLIVHHADLDGILGALKFAGYTYPGLEDDADILDSNGDESKLTPAGALIRDAWRSARSVHDLPTYRHGHAYGAITEIGRYVQSACSDVSAANLRALISASDIRQAQTEMALGLMVMVTPEIALCDTVWTDDFNEKGLSRRMFDAAPGALFAAIRKSRGPLARDGMSQYSIARRNGCETDLREFFTGASGPEHGQIFNVPFLVHVREDRWDGFVKSLTGRIRVV